MTCEECQALATTGDTAAAEHLAGCAACREEEAKTKAALALAAMPALSGEEAAQLGPLAASTWSAWRRAERRKSLWRSVAGLAVAAAVGGLIASAALLRASPHSSAPQRAVVAAADDPALLASDDEFDTSAYEVPWTFDSENPEGEAP